MFPPDYFLLCGDEVWLINVFNFSKSLALECSVFATTCAVVVGVIGEISHVIFLILPREHEQMCLALCTELSCPCRGLNLQQGEHGNGGLFRVIGCATACLPSVQAGAEHNL